jgi:hypothetical protein
MVAIPDDAPLVVSLSPAEPDPSTQDFEATPDAR